MLKEKAISLLIAGTLLLAQVTLIGFLVWLLVPQTLIAQVRLR